MNDPGTQHDQRAGRNDEAAGFVFLDRYARDQPRRRKQTHRFRQHRAREWKVRYVCRSRAAIGFQNRVDLGVQLRLDVRMPREQVPRPRERIRSGLVAREKQRDDFVAELADRHTRTVHAIPGREHERDDVAVRAAVSTAAIDDVVHHAVDRRARSAEPTHARRRKQIGEPCKRQNRHFKKTGRRVERVADLRNDVVTISAKNNPSRNGQGESAHLVGNIDGVSIPQYVTPQRGLMCHDVCIVVHPHGMEGRPNEPSLTSVLRAVTRQEPVTEQSPRTVQRSPFFEAMLLGDEDVLDVFGAIQEKRIVGAEPEVRDVAVLSTYPCEKRQRIAPNLEKASEERPASRSRRKHTKILPRAPKSQGDTSCG